MSFVLYCTRITTSSHHPHDPGAKVNYQYEKRQKELAKKRKKEQKEKDKQVKKNIGPKETDETPKDQPQEK
jgi:hypothetical protein